MPIEKVQELTGLVHLPAKNILNHFVNNLLFKKYPVKAILLFFVTFYLQLIIKPITSP